MNETSPFPTAENEPSREILLSPVRPIPPEQPPAAVSPFVITETELEASDATLPELLPIDTDDPDAAMNALRGRMALIADEYANGKINRAQFDALYQRYGEQRTIIERLIARDPESSAWKQVLGVAENTGYLRDQFEAQALYYAVFRHQQYEPIAAGGRQPPNLSMIESALKRVWATDNRPKHGLGRRPLGSTQWLILATGEHAVTVVLFSLEPSITQSRLVRDLHADFERANAAALVRGWIVPERMVFPQRALMETQL